MDLVRQDTFDLYALAYTALKEAKARISAAREHLVKLESDNLGVEE